MASYDTNLASEFYVLSVLYRLGLDASLTLGNKKSVDIVVVLDESRTCTIDVKANAKKNDWLLGDAAPKVAANHFVVLVAYENAISDIKQLPRCWVVPSVNLPALTKIAGNQKTRYLSRRTILDDAKVFEDAWSLIQ